ncbi:unnamed protein product [Clavelina lepadiformis]|uniref:Thrombospondin-like N-terminal domain-containing protein n=1 Tax=Clavelina lepadiformis TaxID=159417 RepID=A0ABP0F5V7_CLALP
MRKKSPGCAKDDARYMHIDEKRLLSVSMFNCDTPSESSFSVVDLTTVISVPLASGVSFVQGFHGYPAFIIDDHPELSGSAKGLLPETLPNEFSIRTSIKPGNRQGGFLFAVTNELQSVAKFALEIGPVPKDDDHMFIALYMSPSGPAAKVASFQVDNFAGAWTRFAIEVSKDKITLFFNCAKVTEQIVVRNPMKELHFNPKDLVFVAGRGASFFLDAYQGGLQELDLLSDPKKASEQCKDDEPTASLETEGSGSGDDIDTRSGELVDESGETDDGDDGDLSFYITDETEEPTPTPPPIMTTEEAEEAEGAAAGEIEVKKSQENPNMILSLLIPFPLH